MQVGVSLLFAQVVCTRNQVSALGVDFAGNRVDPNTPNLSSMADDAITRAGIQSLVSPLYIYGIFTYLLLNFSLFDCHFEMQLPIEGVSAI